MKRGALAAAVGVSLLVACSSNTGCGSNNTVGRTGDGNTSSSSGSHPTPGSTNPPPPTDVPPSGTIEVTLTTEKDAATDTVVSFGVPFPQGVFHDASKIVVRNGASGESVPASTTVLARWPADGSVRSVLVAAKTTMAANEKASWKVEYGGASGPATEALAPNPDGPVVAVLPAEWYAKSRVSGMLLPVAANKRFATYDAQLDAHFAAIDFSAFGVSCSTTSKHRSYYDGPHAQYQRFLRSGDPAHYRGARAETVLYRQTEVRFHDGKKTAVQVCQPAAWTPRTLIDWHVLRRMASQGNLDDYLLTGDPNAREVVLAFGEAYRLNLPVLTAGPKPPIEATERNLAWTMMGLASYYALEPRPEVRDALVALVDRVAAWQARGTSGALEHDLNRPDPDECADGPKGGSPFMTSLVVDGLMDYWLLTGDAGRVEPIVRKLAEWYEKSALTSDKKAFRYLWNCNSNPYDDSSTADLNLLIGHVFGAAYVLTKDEHWLDFGDSIADSGVSAMFAKQPKQWNQAARSFGRYLGYRAVGRTP